MDDGFHQIEAPGWGADWLLGWLASVGVTYLDRNITLSWVGPGVPYARFVVPDGIDLESLIPDVDSLAIARHLDNWLEFPRNPSIEEYANRAELARSVLDLSVGATTSDIGQRIKFERLEHSPLDAAVPRGITLGERISTVVQSIDANGLNAAMRGHGKMSNQNGLGFDLRRLTASSVPGDNIETSPWTEAFAFFGLLAFDQIGDRTTGWSAVSQSRVGAFKWPTWSVPLSWAGIDAALDAFYQDRKAAWVTGIFESIGYQQTSSSDSTRGYSGQRARE